MKKSNIGYIYNYCLLSRVVCANKAKPIVDEHITVKQRLQSFFETAYCTNQNKKSEIQLNNLVFQYRFSIY